MREWRETAAERRRWAWLVAVLALAAALAVAGCGGDGGDEAADEGAGGTTEAAEEISGDITVWAMGAEGEKLGVLAQDFMRENPDIKVKVTPIAWDVAHDKLLTAVAGGETPDVSQMGTTWMGEFAKTGALAEVPESTAPPSPLPAAAETMLTPGATTSGLIRLSPRRGPREEASSIRSAHSGAAVANWFDSVTFTR